MQIDYQMDHYTFLPSKLHILPSGYDDESMLKNAATRLRVDNPCIKFSEDAKAGKFDELSDLDYERALSVCKRLGLLFYDENGVKMSKDIGIFDLLTVLLWEYIINNHSEPSRII